jgi:hypothetical protein
MNHFKAYFIDKLNEKVYANTPTNSFCNKIYLHFICICTTCFNPELGPLQVLFTNQVTN